MACRVSLKSWVAPQPARSLCCTLLSRLGEILYKCTGLIVGCIAALCIFSATAGSAGVTMTVAVSAPAKHTFEFKIEKRKLAIGNNTIRITKGDSVEIRWAADEAMTVHIHGYNAETRVKPGMTAVMRFDAYATGRFPVEAHPFSRHEDNAPHRGGVTLLYLEVHPR